MDKTAGGQTAKTVVCVTDQRRCDRLIRAGRMLADMSGTGLTVISVVRPERQSDAGSMEYLFSVSRENDAEMVLLYSEDVAKAIIKYIKASKVVSLLTGIPARGDPVTGRVWSKFTHIGFFVVGEDGRLTAVPNPARAAKELCRPALEGA